jgi:Na+/H+ antiporter NhaD/arsenite permease-like protein
MLNLCGHPQLFLAIYRKYGFMLLTALIVLFTYVGIAIGRVPYTRMNRATIALVGAMLLVLVGAISEEQALHSLDMGTILLLGAMMIINVNLRLAGFYDWVTFRTLRLARTPRLLLALIVVSAGVLSAIFLNDPVCLLMTPLVVDLTLLFKRDPIPYLVGLGTASNVGSVATITGNPQNIIIGQSSGISYLDFLLHLAPVALIGLLICWAVIVLVYPQEFRGTLATDMTPTAPTPHRPLLSRTLLVVGVLMFAFLSGAPIITSACVAGGVLLVSRLKPTKLLHIDWDLLAMFAGLFVVTGAIESSGLSNILFENISPFLQQGILPFTLATGVLSNVVSNVPAVLLFRPEVPNFPNPEQTWLALAMASTLAGNFTLLGSAATLIVAEVAQTRGVKLSFMAFLRAGVPITILTLIVGMVWLSVFP